MGILNHKTLLSHMHTTRCNIKPNKFNIIFDGEIMRYKGHVADNLVSADCTYKVAKSAFDYIVNIVKLITTYFNRAPETIKVYFDGARPTSKVVRGNEAGYNTTDCKELIKAFCVNEGYEISHPESGEAEFLMYSKRDKTADLNVFVTSDSDFISIVYGHKGKFGQAPRMNDVNASFQLGGQTSLLELDDKMQGTMISSNIQHVDGKDSCAWFRCGIPVHTLYGMDGLQDIFALDANHFRILVAIMGTDYTSGILTKTMIENVLVNVHKRNTNNEAYADIVNDQSYMRESVAALFYLACMTKCTPSYKPVNKQADELSFENCLANYLNYINGVGTANMIYSYESPSIFQKYMSEMLKEQPPIKAKNLKRLETMSISEALANISASTIKCQYTYTGELILPTGGSDFDNSSNIVVPQQFELANPIPNEVVMPAIIDQVANGSEIDPKPDSPSSEAKTPTEADKSQKERSQMSSLFNDTEEMDLKVVWT